MDGTVWVITERSAMLSRLYYGLTIPLLVITVLTLALRFYLRIRPVYKLGLDDWCVLLGTVRYSVSSFSLGSNRSRGPIGLEQPNKAQDQKTNQRPGVDVCRRVLGHAHLRKVHHRGTEANAQG